MSAARDELEKYLTENEIEYSIDESGRFLFYCRGRHMEDYNVVIYVHDYDNVMVFISNVIGRFKTPELRNAALEMCNQCNLDYKFFTFFVDSEDYVELRRFQKFEISDIGKIAEEYIHEMSELTDKVYIKFLRLLYEV